MWEDLSDFASRVFLRVLRFLGYKRSQRSRILREGPVSYCYSYVDKYIVREAEVILLTFLRGKSILLLNCSLDVQ